MTSVNPFAFSLMKPTNLNYDIVTIDSTPQMLNTVNFNIPQMLNSINDITIVDTINNNGVNSMLDFNIPQMLNSINDITITDQINGNNVVENIYF
jgi:hypothetical protein